MSYIAVHFFTASHSSESLEILIALLDNYGFEGVYEHDSGITAYIPEIDFNDEFISEIQSSFKNLGSPLDYKTEKIIKQNWNRIWESNFDPVIIDSRCVIRAPFHPNFPEIKFQITIEPKMSFGTGHHQTTRLMIEQMFENYFENKQVLDMGCGTGVLAILASILGADSVTAIDIDSWAYENTQENVAKNSRENVQVLQGSVEAIPNQKYDIVLANINRNILINQMPYYSRHTLSGGRLLLSGILSEDDSIIKREAAREGFIFISGHSLEKWEMMIFERK